MAYIYIILIVIFLGAILTVATVMDAEDLQK